MFRYSVPAALSKPLCPAGALRGRSPADAFPAFGGGAARLITGPRECDPDGAGQAMAFRNLQSLRNALPILLGVALFALGIYALYHLLSPVDPADVAAQIRATPPLALAAALGATAVAYGALIFYDWFGLRFIGKMLDSGVVALGGFLGYAFGNTIGISVVSGGAVRYRIYSAVGLNALEVAAVSGYIGIALGTGLTLIGLAALALHPGAIGAYLPYAPGTIRALAGGAVALALAMIVWLSATQRSLAIRGYQLRLPPLPDLGGQLVVTLVDVAAAAFALWILLPEGKPDYTIFIAIYAAATMVGVLSHVPGGIGVFETVVIGTLPASVPVSDAAAALLLFRMIYYLLPFGLAFLLVALNEARLARGLRRRLLARMPAIQPALVTLHGLVPGLVAVVAFAFGLYLLLVTMVPSVRADALAERDLAAILLLEGGTIASAVAGVTLLIVSHGLARRVSSAYWFAMAALAAGAVASLLTDAGIRNAAFLGLGAGALVPFRAAFDRPGHLTQGVFGARWFATVFGAGLATAAFFFFVHKTVPYSTDLWSEFATGSATPRALRAGLAASALLFVFSVFMLTRPARRAAPAAEDHDPRARAAALCREAQDPQAWLSQTGDKRLLFSANGRAFLMYGVRGPSWIALGDPVGDPADFEALCLGFAEKAAEANGRPIFYEVGDRHLPLWRELGLSLNTVAEEAVLRLCGGVPKGEAGQGAHGLRPARQPGEREFSVLRPPHDPALWERLRPVSEAWLGALGSGEKGFSVGRFDPAYLGRFDIAVIREAGGIVAFANLLSTCGGRFVTVDLLRYLPEEAPRIMEEMVRHLIAAYTARGVEELSLGTAPLAGLSERSAARSWNRFGRLIYRHGTAFDSFEALRAFKQQFGPDWRPRHLALPPNVSPLTAMRDTALLIADGTRGRTGR